MPWVWITRDMMGSHTWAALSISARRVLDAMMLEHMSHAGRENGHLAVTYLQLEAFGVTKADIRRALQELLVCGWIRMTHQGLRVAGGGEPSRFALTWLPTQVGSSMVQGATNDWLDVRVGLTGRGFTTVRSVRRWLRDQVHETIAPRRKTALPQVKGTHPQDIEGTSHLRGQDLLQVSGETPEKIIAFRPHLRGGSGIKGGVAS